MKLGYKFKKTLSHFLFRFKVAALSSLWILGLAMIAAILFFPPSFKKILSLTSLGSSLSLNDNLKSKIKVEGNYRTSSQNVISVLMKISAKHGGLSFIEENLNSKSLCEEIKSELPWVKHLVLKRSLPDKLNVTITEYEPFAIWYEGKFSYIIDRDGNKIPSTEQEQEEFRNLITLYGKNANLHAKSLLNIITADPSLSANIDSANWVGNRRWDIKLNSGTLIKLPAENLNQAWQRLIQLYRTKGLSSDLDLIDLRVEGKMYLESNPKPVPTSF